MNKRGFTLMELLAVIVILGIITMISIPIYNNIQDNSNQDNYEYYEKMVKSATEIYVDQYAPNFNASTSCIKLNYNRLLSTNLVKEEILTCDGYIIGNRVNNGFKYDIYLDCKDDKGNFVVKNKSNTPSKTCKEIN